MPKGREGVCSKSRRRGKGKRSPLGRKVVPHQLYTSIITGRIIGLRSVRVKINSPSWSRISFRSQAQFGSRFFAAFDSTIFLTSCLISRKKSSEVFICTKPRLIISGAAGKVSPFFFVGVAYNIKPDFSVL